MKTAILTDTNSGITVEKGREYGIYVLPMPIIIEEQNYLEANAYQASIYITVNSLKYLKKSGRITPSAAAIANVLNIKPVLTIQGEKLDSFAKVRGTRQSEKRMIEALQADLAVRFSNIPSKRLQIGTAGTFESEEDAHRWQDMVQSAFPEIPVYYFPLSCLFCESFSPHTALPSACSPSHGWLRSGLQAPDGYTAVSHHTNSVHPDAPCHTPLPESEGSFACRT